LRRLATKLEDAVVPDGRAYRLGGDEFCVLWHGGAENDLARLGVAAAALGDQGEGFVVTAARGAVTLPDEAQTSDEALRVADHRMYAHKRGRSTATKEQIRNVALSAMAEQAGDEDSDVADVARMATSVGKRLGIQGEGLRDLAYAAELHDVGKIAIPDTILHKVGPLDDDEMEFMRRHTIIGEAILGAAPAFFTVAKYVRSSHERFDGSGYPDGLSGSDIPLASRVVFVCDAFSAMTGQRCYRPRMTTAQARDELRRCAGSQFDPEAVQAFCDVLDSPPAVPAPVGALALR
jgi:response regulator RpfG family c-di-GMP phosphodiesterase